MDYQKSTLRILILSTLTALSMVLFSDFAAATSYEQTNLVSDIPGLAAFTDPNLVNPWGITSTPTSPLWVSDNGSGHSTLYNGSGQPQPQPTPLVVTIPPVPGSPPGTHGTPTGVVFNIASVGGAFNSDLFIFATEDGLITGWRGALGTTAEILVISSTGSVYKGLAFATIGTNSYLYAADFHNNRIDVTPSAGAPSLPGNFTDPNLPAGFAPFNIQNINGRLYVTYAKVDALGKDDVPGPGNGLVDVFDLNGNFIQRLVTMGRLNSPWGLAIAPSNFGQFSNDLLVGNFGDGTINAFDPLTGAYLGTLLNGLGNPIVIEGLWGLRFGNGGNGGAPDSLFFAAGIPGTGDIEDHGLFGTIRVQGVPEPNSLMLLLCGCGIIAVACHRTRGSKMPG